MSCFILKVLPLCVMPCFTLLAFVLCPVLINCPDLMSCTCVWLHCLLSVYVVLCLVSLPLSCSPLCLCSGLVFWFGFCIFVSELCPWDFGFLPVPYWMCLSDWIGLWFLTIACLEVECY